MNIQNLSYELGKIPPQATELEEAVLGAMILESESIDRVKALIPPEAFYKESHRIICEAIYDLHKRIDPVDTLTLVEELKQRGKLDQVGGPYFLTQLTDKVASAAHVEYHAKVVLEKYVSREVIRLSTNGQEQAFRSDVDIMETIAEALKSLDGLLEMVVGKHNRTLVDIITDTLDELNRPKDQLFGVPTPLTTLNILTNGWQPADLIILAGRPSRGKTAFALANVRTACEAGKNVAVFSLEMKDTQLMKRLIYSLDRSYEEAGGIISTWNLDIFEKGGIGIDYIVGKSRLLKRTTGLDLIVIDYLGLMRLPKAENRAYAIGEVTRALKALAKELNVPVMLLAQLNRDIEKRGSHAHVLSDLRESGDIEQDADVVVFISRPYMDGVVEDRDGNPTDYLTVIQIEKHRNGKAPVKIKARNNERVNYYRDWDEIPGAVPTHQPEAF
jgi:replicative DNA helicase